MASVIWVEVASVDVPEVYWFEVAVDDAAGKSERLDVAVTLLLALGWAIGSKVDARGLDGSSAAELSSAMLGFASSAVSEEFSAFVELLADLRMDPPRGLLGGMAVSPGS